MYYAIVNQENEFLMGHSQDELVFGSIDRAAQISEGTRNLWEKLYPGITALIESRQVALIAHPNYRCIGVNKRGFEVYEVGGDPSYLIMGDSAFEVEQPQKSQEEECFSLNIE